MKERVGEKLRKKEKSVRCRTILNIITYVSLEPLKQGAEKLPEERDKYFSYLIKTIIPIFQIKYKEIHTKTNHNHSKTVIKRTS